MHSQRGVGPVNALCQRILCRCVLGRKVVNKSHDAVGAGATAAAGNGYLCVVAPGDRRRVASSDAVFSDDGGCRDDRVKGSIQNIKSWFTNQGRGVVTLEKKSQTGSIKGGALRATCRFTAQSAGPLPGLRVSCAFA